MRDDVLVRRIEADIIAFALLVVGFGVLTPVAATVQVNAAPGAVLVGNVTLRAVGPTGAILSITRTRTDGRIGGLYVASY